MKLDEAPIFSMYRLTISTENRKRFLDVGQDNLLTSIKNEPGTLAMYSTHLASDTGTNFVFELYRDEVQYQIHANSPQFKRYGMVAKDILLGTEKTKLMPQYLYNEGPFKISENGERKAVLYHLNIQLSDVKHWQNLLSDAIVDLYHYGRGLLTFYAGTTNEELTDWMILIIYKDQSTVNAMKQSLQDILTEINLKLTKQVLVIDTIVSQDELEFSNDL